MKVNKMAGFFISFEGIDKSGKSTQAEKLVAHLRENGKDVVFTHEPGATELGREIRHLALDWEPRDGGDVDARAEMFLFAADRAQHVNELIRPSLKADKVVITDRYVDSTMAYQGYGRGLDLGELKDVQDLATGGLLPDMTVWVDVDLQTARDRGWGQDADRMESASDAVFQRVREGFAALCKSEPNRIVRIDGTQSVERVWKDVKTAVRARLDGGPLG